MFVDLQSATDGQKSCINVTDASFWYVTILHTGTHVISDAADDVDVDIANVVTRPPIGHRWKDVAKISFTSSYYIMCFHLCVSLLDVLFKHCGMYTNVYLYFNVVQVTVCLNHIRSLSDKPQILCPLQVRSSTRSRCMTPAWRRLTAFHWQRWWTSSSCAFTADCHQRFTHWMTSRR